MKFGKTNELAAYIFAGSCLHDHWPV